MTYSDPSGYSSLPEFSAVTSIQGTLNSVRNSAAIYLYHRILAVVGTITAVSAACFISSNVILEHGVDGALSGTGSTGKITSDLLMKAVDAVVYAYVVAGSGMMLDIVSGTVEAVKTDVETNAIELKKANKKQFKGHCVYVLRDSENDNKVSYVGRSKNPWARYLRHQKDQKKQTNKKPWKMYIVKDGLTLKEAAALENALICIYTLQALSNARHEIAQKNYPGFELEFKRAASICKLPIKRLYDVMKGDYK